MNRTAPFAFSRTIFLPVAGNSPRRGHRDLAVVAGIDAGLGVHGVAAGSAVTVNEIGPIVSIWGVTVMSAAGRTVTRGHGACAEEQQQDEQPTASARPLTPRRRRSLRHRAADGRLRLGRVLATPGAP